MTKYLIVLFASLALMACTNQSNNQSTNQNNNQSNNKSKEVVQADGDPSYAIMKTINDTNRNIANTTSSIPTPSVK